MNAPASRVLCVGEWPVLDNLPNREHPAETPAAMQIVTVHKTLLSVKLEFK